LQGEYNAPGRDDHRQGDAGSKKSGTTSDRLSLIGKQHNDELNFISPVLSKKSTLCT